MCHRITAALFLTATIAGNALAADYPFGDKVNGTGKPMILIPGLGCDGAVWDTTVAHFKNDYECHVLTPAGFSTQTPVKGPFFETMSAGIARYVRDKKLNKPVLVGHSIGAALALRTAADHPDLFGAVVAVDGFPCMFALFAPDTSAEAMRKAGEDERAKIEAATREDYIKARREMFGRWLEGEKLDTAMKWLTAADQPTFARAMGEIIALDLRPDMAKVTAPVLLLGAYEKVYEKYGVTRATFEERLKAQLAKAKTSAVAIRDDSKHFIMYDQPEWMWKEMATFLKRMK